MGTILHILQIKIPVLKILACQRLTHKVVELRYKPGVNLILKPVIITITQTASPSLQLSIILKDQF